MKRTKQSEIDYLKSVVEQLAERLKRQTSTENPCGGCMSSDSGSCDDHYVLFTAALALQGHRREHHSKRFWDGSHDYE